MHYRCRIIGKWDKCIFAWIHPLTEEKFNMALDCCIQQFNLVMTSNSKHVFFFKMKCKILGRGCVLRKHESAMKLFIGFQSEIQAYLSPYAHFDANTFPLVMKASSDVLFFWVKYFFVLGSSNICVNKD